MVSLRSLTVLALALLSACGPTVKVNPAAQNINTIALLPAKYPDDMPRERVQAVRDAIANELRNSSFILLDEKIVSSICPQADCANVKDLGERYHVDGIARLQIDTASRNNFIAGYYNTLRGSLKIESPAGGSLVTVDHTERERGGLLFNAGQIIQGIKSQIENSGDHAFDQLAARFARSVVAELPRQKRAGEDQERMDASQVNIEQVELTPIGGSVYRICANGTPHEMAAVVLGRIRSNLREVSIGHYCGAYRYDDLLYGGRVPIVEVRSAYGERVSRPLEQQQAMSCNLEGLVHLKESGNTREIELSCIRGSDASTTVRSEQCDTHAQNCTVRKLLVYKAEEPLGPFEKVAEIPATRWRDPHGHEDAIYEVVAIDSRGGSTLPVQAK